jgi:DNA-directed RNA polymerase specialized sigma24 family protein
MDEFGNEIVASPEEVKSAIAGLSSDELKNLASFARFRSRIAHRQAHGRDFEDLLQDAIAATVTGHRPWRMKVSFAMHLKGCIRSISNGWMENKQLDEVSLTGGAARTGDREMDSDRTSRELGGPFPQYETELDAKKALQQIHAAFPPGTRDRNIIDLWAEGYEQQEIVDALHISLSTYKTAAHRIKHSNIIRLLTRKKASHV